MNDWVKCYRSTLDWGWFTDVPTAHLWEYIRLKAYWDANYFKGELIEKGSFPTTVQAMSVETGLTNEQVRLALKKLKTTGEITVRTTNKYTVISVVKWAEYQGEGGCDTKQTPSSDTKQKPNGEQTDTKKITNPLLQKEDKKVRNKEDNTHKRFVKPTVSEVREYCSSRNNGIDPEEFVDFYESKNWMVGKSKMADWKACIRTWERSRNSRTTKPKDEVPTYDAAGNHNMSAEEADELLRLMKGGQ